jgi:hypothetical protein
MLVRARHDMVLLALTFLVFLLTTCACLSGFQVEVRWSTRLYAPPSAGVGILLYSQTCSHDLIADRGEGGRGRLGGDLDPGF